MEDQLLLGGDELEEGQLQRSIWNKREGRKRTAGSGGGHSFTLERFILP